MENNVDPEDSLMEPVCIDDEVFFGPITEKERQIAEEVNKRYGTFSSPKSSFRNKVSSKNIDIDVTFSECNNSDNSVYKSFSVDGSKFESFIDSIDSELNQNKFLSSFLPEQLNENVKKTINTKPRASALYDSLEDICSLVSNAEKLSISDEMENAISVPGRHQMTEDSVNPCGPENMNMSFNDQMHFDDDSLAIVEFEKTFDDSLEEFGLPACIEVRSLSDSEKQEENVIEPLAEETNSPAAANLFETSVQNLVEKITFSDSLEEKELMKILNCDSLSSSEHNGISKDSLAETRDERVLICPKECVCNSSEKKLNIAKDKSNSSAASNLFETSVPTFIEKITFSDSLEEKELLKNLNCDSLSSSERNGISKDSLAESKDECALNSSKNSVSNSSENKLNIARDKAERKSFFEQNLLDASVQIVYEKIESSNSFSRDNNLLETVKSKDVSVSSSDLNGVSKDSLSESIKFNYPAADQNILNEVESCDLEELHVCKAESEKLVPETKEAFDTSVFIVYEKMQNQEFSEKFIDPSIHFFPTSRDMKNSRVEKGIISNVTEANENSLVYKTGKLKHEKCSTNAPVIGAASVLKKELSLSPTASGHSSNQMMEVVKRSVREVEMHEESYSIINDVDLENKNVLPSTLCVDKETTQSDLNLKVHIELTFSDSNHQIDSKNVQISSSVELGGKNKLDINLKPEGRLVKGQCPKMQEAKNICVSDERKPKVNIEDISKVRQKVLYKMGINSPQAKNDAKSKKIKRECNASFRKGLDLFNELQNSSTENPLLQALDLHDASINFRPSSFLQSRDSIMPLNLCLRDTSLDKGSVKFSSKESKENIPENFSNMQHYRQCIKQGSNSPELHVQSKTQRKITKRSSNSGNTPKLDNQKGTRTNIQQKSSGTKIPVRKVDNFGKAFLSPKSVMPKQRPVSVEKLKQNSPLCAKVISRTASVPVVDAMPKKGPHFCILPSSASKLPKSAAQILSAKKFQNIQSPVGQYMRKTPGLKLATPVIRPLRCMTNATNENPVSESASQTTVRKIAKKKP